MRKKPSILLLVRPFSLFHLKFYSVDKDISYKISQNYSHESNNLLGQVFHSFCLVNPCLHCFLFLMKKPYFKDIGLLWLNYLKALLGSRIMSTFVALSFPKE